MSVEDFGVAVELEVGAVGEPEVVEELVAVWIMEPAEVLVSFEELLG